MFELDTLKRSDVPRDLLKGPDVNFLLKILFLDWLVIAACWVCMFYLPTWTWIVWIPLIAGRIHGFGVIVHDLTHMGKKKNKPLKWRVIEVFAGYPIGTTINAMAYHHLRHHRNTLFENDPYFKLNKKCSKLKRVLLTFGKGPMLPIFWVLRSAIGTFSFVFPKLRSVYAKGFLQEQDVINHKSHQEILECCLEDIPLFVFHLSLFALAISFPIIFSYFYLPLLIGGTFCIYRLLIEHEYDIVEDKSIYTMIECTFDHHTSGFDKLFLGPHNIGYHCMHHIHPAVGLQNLPQLRDWYLKNSKQYSQKYSNGIVA